MALQKRKSSPPITQLQGRTTLCADDMPIVAPPSLVDVTHEPRVLLYSANGQPLFRKVGY